MSRSSSRDTSRGRTSQQQSQPPHKGSRRSSASTPDYCDIGIDSLRNASPLRDEWDKRFMHLPTERRPKALKEWQILLTPAEITAALAKIAEYRDIIVAQQARFRALYARITDSPAPPPPTDGPDLPSIVKGTLLDLNLPLSDTENVHLEWCRDEMDSEMKLLEEEIKDREERLEVWEKLPDGSRKDWIKDLEFLNNGECGRNCLCKLQDRIEELLPDQRQIAKCDVHGYPHYCGIWEEATWEGCLLQRRPARSAELRAQARLDSDLSDEPHAAQGKSPYTKDVDEAISSAA